MNQDIQELALRLCADQELDLVHLEIKKVNQVMQIEILTDLPKGGIRIDQCTLLNKRLCEALDERELFPHGYTMKVSSPGVDRPLRDGKDFNRVIGRPVRFYLSEKIAEKLEHVGVVHSATDQEVKITRESDTLTIPFNLINKAVQEI